MKSSQSGNDSTTDRIVIVGGGTAGWLTAALLSHHLTPIGVSIQIVDDGTDGIGVGEATIPSIVRLLRTLGADEFEFMRSCDATWKLGIQFSNWLRDGHNYWHMFGACGGRIDGRDLFGYWLTNQSRPYHSYSLHWGAALAGKSPHSRSTRSPLTETGAYAFHLDAGKLAAWLRSRAIQSGVERIDSRVSDVKTDHAGQVVGVVLENGIELHGRLFVDCSGFDAVLSDKLDRETWVSYSDRLLCDRAVACSGVSAPVVPTHTVSSAMNAGWQWTIPLMSRTGFGYVYSSQFTDDESATKELLETNRIDSNDAEPRLLKFRVGRLKKFWRRNVVSIGLAAGFVEPLESSGLHLVQIGVESLLRYLPAFGEALTAAEDAYNKTLSAIHDEVADFVQLHYLLSQREEEFWKAAQTAPVSDPLRDRLRLFDESGMTGALQPEAFPDTSYFYLLSGNERLPNRPPALAAAVDAERLSFVMKAMLDQNRAILRQLPLHEDMLREVHQQPLADVS